VSVICQNWRLRRGIGSQSTICSIRTFRSQNFSLTPFPFFSSAFDISFVYEGFGNATEGTSSSSKEVVRSFFGAVPDASSKGGFKHVAERFPENWYRRADPYTLTDVIRQIGSSELEVEQQELQVTTSPNF